MRNLRALRFSPHCRCRPAARRCRSACPGDELVSLRELLLRGIVDVGVLDSALNELNRAGIRPLSTSTNSKHQGRRRYHHGGEDQQGQSFHCPAPVLDGTFPSPLLMPILDRQAANRLGATTRGGAFVPRPSSG